MLRIPQILKIIPLDQEKYLTDLIELHLIKETDKIKRELAINLQKDLKRIAQHIQC